MPILTKINNVYRASRKLRPGMRIFERYKSSRVPPRFADARRSVSWGDILKHDGQKDIYSDSRIYSRIRINEPNSGLVLNMHLKYSFRKKPIPSPKLQQDPSECENRKNMEHNLRHEDAWNNFVEDAATFDQHKHVEQPVAPSCSKNIETARSRDTGAAQLSKTVSKNNLRKFIAKVHGKVDVRAPHLNNQQIVEVLQRVVQNTLVSSLHTLLALNDASPEHVIVNNRPNLDVEKGKSTNRVKSIEIGTSDETFCLGKTKYKETSSVPYGDIASVIQMKEKHEILDAVSASEKKPDTCEKSAMQRLNDQMHSKYNNSTYRVQLSPSTADEASLKSEECSITVTMNKEAVNQCGASDQSDSPLELDLAKQFANDTLALASKHINTSSMPSRQASKKGNKLPGEIPPLYHIFPKWKEHENSKRNQFIAQSWSQRAQGYRPHINTEATNSSSNSSHPDAPVVLSTPSLSCSINELPTNQNCAAQTIHDFNSELSCETSKKLDSPKHFSSEGSIDVAGTPKNPLKSQRIKSHRKYCVFKPGNFTYVKNRRLYRRKYESDNSVRYTGTRSFKRKSSAALLYQGQGRNFTKPFTSDGRRKSGNIPPEVSKGDEKKSKPAAYGVITYIRDVLIANMTKHTKIDPPLEKPQHVVAPKAKCAEILEAVKKELQKAKLTCDSIAQSSGGENQSCKRKPTNLDSKVQAKDKRGTSYSKELPGTSFTQLISPTIDFKDNCSNKVEENFKKELLRRIKIESSKNKSASGKNGKHDFKVVNVCTNISEPHLNSLVDCSKAISQDGRPPGKTIECNTSKSTSSSNQTDSKNEASMKGTKSSSVDSSINKPEINNCLNLQNLKLPKLTDCSSSCQKQFEKESGKPFESNTKAPTNSSKQSENSSGSNVGKPAFNLDVCSNAEKQADVPNCKLFDRSPSKLSVTNASSSRDVIKNTSQDGKTLDCYPVSRLICAKKFKQSTTSTDGSSTSSGKEIKKPFDCSLSNKSGAECFKILQQTSETTKSSEKANNVTFRPAKTTAVDCSHPNVQPAKSSEKRKMESDKIKTPECKPTVDCDKVLQGLSNKSIDCSSVETQSKSSSGNTTTQGCKPPVDCAKVLRGQSKKSSDDSSTEKSQQKTEVSKQYDRDSCDTSDDKSTSITCSMEKSASDASRSKPIDCSKYTRVAEKFTGQDNKKPVDCSKYTRVAGKSTGQVNKQPVDCSKYTRVVDRSTGQDNQQPIDCSKVLEGQSTKSAPSNCVAAKCAEKASSKQFECSSTKTSSTGGISDKIATQVPKTMPIDCSKQSAQTDKSANQGAKPPMDCAKISNLQASNPADICGSIRDLTGKSTEKLFDCSSTSTSVGSQKPSCAGDKGTPAQPKITPIDFSKYNVTTKRSIDCAKASDVQTSKSKQSTSSGKGCFEKTSGKPSDCASSKTSIVGAESSLCGSSKPTSSAQQIKSIDCSKYKVKTDKAPTQEPKSVIELQSGKSLDCNSLAMGSSEKLTATPFECSPSNASVAGWKASCQKIEKLCSHGAKAVSTPIDCAKYNVASTQDRKPGVDCSKALKTSPDKLADCSSKGNTTKSQTSKLFDGSSSCAMEKPQSQSTTFTSIDCSKYKKVTDKPPGQNQECKPPTDCSKVLQGQQSKPVECSKVDTKSPEAGSKPLEASKQPPIDCSKYKKGGTKLTSQVSNPPNDCSKVLTQEIKAIDCTSKPSKKSANKLFDHNASKASYTSTWCNTSAPIDSSQYKAVADKPTIQDCKPSMNCAAFLKEQTNKPSDCEATEQQKQEKCKPIDCSSPSTSSDTGKTSQATKTMPTDCSKYKATDDKPANQDCKPTIDYAKVLAAQPTKSVESSNTRTSSEKAASKLFDRSSCKTSLASSLSNEKGSSQATEYKPIDCSKYNTNYKPTNQGHKAAIDGSKTSCQTTKPVDCSISGKKSSERSNNKPSDCSSSRTYLTAAASSLCDIDKATSETAKNIPINCSKHQALKDKSTNQESKPVIDCYKIATKSAGGGQRQFKPTTGKLFDCGSSKLSKSSSCVMQKEPIHASKNAPIDCSKHRVGTKKSTNQESQPNLVSSRVSESKTNKSAECSSSTPKRENGAGKLIERSSSKKADYNSASCFSAENAACQSTTTSINCSKYKAVIEKIKRLEKVPKKSGDISESQPKENYPKSIAQAAECSKYKQNTSDVKGKSNESAEIRPVATCIPFKMPGAAGTGSMQAGKQCSPAADTNEKHKPSQAACADAPKHGAANDSSPEAEKPKTQGPTLAKRIDFSKQKYNATRAKDAKDVPKATTCTPVLCIKNLEVKRQEAVKRVKLKKYKAEHYNNCCLKITGQRKVEVDNCPMPPMSDECVVIRMHSVGISVSDVYMFEKGIQKLDSFDISLGHEGAGEIVETGQKVTSLRKGDRVCIEAGIPCGCCKFCRLGRYNICPYMQFSGLLATYCRHPARLCHKIPKSMSYDEAALAHPLSLGLQVCDRGHVSVGSRVLILGACPLGLSSVIAARAMGADKIAVVDVLEKNLHVASELCADVSILANQSMSCQELVEKVLSEMKCRPNVIIDCCGCSKTVKMAVDLAEQGGELVLAGCQADRADFPILMALAKEICFHTSFRSSNMFRKAINMIESGRAQVCKMITHRTEFCETQKGFEVALNEAEKGTIKVMVNWRHERNDS